MQIGDKVLYKDSIIGTIIGIPEGTDDCAWVRMILDPPLVDLTFVDQLMLIEEFRILGKTEYFKLVMQDPKLDASVKL